MALDNQDLKFWAKLGQDFQLLRGRRHGSAAAEQKYVVQQKSRQRQSLLALYSGLLFWGLLAAWVLLNLLASQFPAKLNIDASDDQLYSLSKTSQTILQGLEQDVTIYALFSEGQRPTQPLDIYRYLELYAAASPHIRIEEVDPELEPGRIRPFITGLRSRNEGQAVGRGANKTPQRNSLIVFTRGAAPRYRVIHDSDLYYVMERFGPKNAGIRAEQQISSAITYVNGAKLTRLGLLSGHREQSLAPIQPNFEQFNIAEQSVNLIQNTAILQDLDVLLIYKPQLDINDAEYQTLRTFLEEGKALWLVLDFQAERLANLYKLAADYGIEILEGLVLERDSRRIQAASGYTTFVTPISQLPRPNENEGLHPITQPLQDNKISDLLWIQSMAVRESLPHSRRLRFYSLVESSESSLLRSSRDPSSKTQLDGDISGPLTLMGLSVWQNEQGHRSGPALLLSFDAPGSRSVFSTPSNLQLFYSALSWLGDPQKDTVGGANQFVFPSKSLLMLPMRLSQAQAISWALVFVILLPLLLLSAGLLFLRHRKHL